ncbi:MAG: T9SS type A sorting domain-containing protein [Chitinophagaceae bacterium]|nr:T9SS type A sorting domain-containing protein [Chitinophagaceae bacterium]
MKKLLFLGLSLLTSSVFAQYKNQQLLELTNTPSAKIKKTVDLNALNAKKQQNNDKKTRGSKVRYNIVDYVAAEQGIAASDMYSYQQGIGGTNPNGRMVINYLWPDSTMRYGSTSAVGITFQSIGQTLDPLSKVFSNNLTAGDAQIGPTNSYSVDSFYIQCSYVRKAAQASVVDTLILSFVTEDAQNLGVSGWTSGNVVTNFAADTVTFLAQVFDSLNSKPPVQKNEAGGGAPVIIKKILDQAAANDTISGGWNYYGFAPGINVPAGKAVSVSVSFKPGVTWTSTDTIEAFNNFTFVSHEENIGGFFSYTKWDMNTSNVVTKTSNYIGNPQGWGGTYVPSLAYTAPYAYELHNMDWILNCPTCKTVGVEDLSNNVRVNAYPNPASSDVNFDLNFAVSSKNVSIELSNVLGQVLKTNTLGVVSANQNITSTMNVSDLAAGLYIYTINANGEKMSGKIMVK